MNKNQQAQGKVQLSGGISNPKTYYFKYLKMRQL